MARKFNQPTVGDLVATIGYGGIMPSQIVPKVKELYEKDYVKKSSEIKVVDDINKHSIGEQEYTKKRKKSSPQGIIVKGVDNILVRFAKCCNPIPGDEIIGYITKGRGVAVHRKDCPNSNLDNDYFKNRLVEVSWENSNNAKFEAEIQIQAEDRRGIINDITHIVAIEKVSLNGINARKGKLNIVSVNLLVEVDSIETLTLLMKKVRAIPGVEDIYRVIN